MADQSIESMNVTNKSDYIPKVALGVAAHPDDLDFGMSGTIAKWAAAGCDVYYLILTNGNKGSADMSADPQELTKIRRTEQRMAAKILGVKDVFFCDYDDGTLEVSQAVKRDIVRIIRRIKPEAVLTMDPSVLYDAERGIINHPDHRAAGQATLDAVFPLARDHMSFPELLQVENLQPHKVTNIFLMNFVAHNCKIDITQFIDIKMDAIAAHKSQMPNLKSTQNMIRQMAAKNGESIQALYAEAYIMITVEG